MTPRYRTRRELVDWLAWTKGVGVGYTLATGRLFCSISDFHEYAESLLGRPVLTHEFADQELWEEMRGRFEAFVTELSSTEGKAS